MIVIQLWIYISQSIIRYLSTIHALIHMKCIQQLLYKPWNKPSEEEGSGVKF